MAEASRLPHPTGSPPATNASQAQTEGASGCAVSVVRRRLCPDLVLNVTGLAAGEDGRERAQCTVDVLLELLDLLQPIKDFAAFERGKMFVALCARRPRSTASTGTLQSALATVRGAVTGEMAPNLPRPPGWRRMEATAGRATAMVSPSAVTATAQSATDGACERFGSWTACKLNQLLVMQFVPRLLVGFFARSPSSFRGRSPCDLVQRPLLRCAIGRRLRRCSQATLNGALSSSRLPPTVLCAFGVDARRRSQSSVPALLSVVLVLRHRKPKDDRLRPRLRLRPLLCPLSCACRRASASAASSAFVLCVVVRSPSRLLALPARPMTSSNSSAPHSNQVGSTTL